MGKAYTARMCFLFATLLALAVIGTGWLGCTLDSTRWNLACVIQGLIFASGSIGLFVVGAKQYERHRH